MGVSGNTFPLLGDADFQRDHFQYSLMMGLNGQYLNYFPGFPAVKLAMAMHKFACLKEVNETGLEEHTGPLLRFQRRLLEWCLCLPKSRARGWLGAGCGAGWGMPVCQWETTGCGVGLALPGSCRDNESVVGSP